MSPKSGAENGRFSWEPALAAERTGGSFTPDAERARNGGGHYGGPKRSRCVLHALSSSCGRYGARFAAAGPTAEGWEKRL